MTVDAPPRATRSGWLSALRELGLVAVLFLVYKVGRLAATGHVAQAYDNARTVWDLERRLRLPGELSVQHRLLSWHWLVEVANCYYAYVHFPATAACLIWLYLRRPAHYRWTRNVLVLLTGAALLVHFVMPLAPPRMLTGTGMLDLGRLYGPAVYGAPETDQLSNQYAAMPSLHVGWAVVVAIALISATSMRWRALWLLHPVITLLVVVATGNHYWLDAIAAGALLAVAYAVVRSQFPGGPDVPVPGQLPGAATVPAPAVAAVPGAGRGDSSDPLAASATVAPGGAPPPSTPGGAPAVGPSGDVTGPGAGAGVSVRASVPRPRVPLERSASRR
ncbi:phosphatase PAP2 family protein [Actinoplanes teichomyceticus]|uniref:PAP2 superfamily protein n=1 Tax=Actinoplanes teichomyceticus TaxID=1867 RepID=A0A561WLN0_ACTTI|nr:phosphatase PAP2 family protein [Actinoplanes teichomyceticus]TWG24769.1 PAP2 superfamily protein [Actinoplanes teichomyceticus]GIF14568.1 inositol phosphorylceramide synthase [Actinoplanes teichomyceticus]